MLAAQEVTPVVVRALVDALDRERALLQRAGVLPQGLASRRLQNADTVGQSRPVQSVALGASAQPDLALAFAPGLVPEERARLQELVSCKVK